MVSATLLLVLGSVAAQSHRANNEIVGGPTRSAGPLPHEVHSNDTLPAALDWRRTGPDSTTNLVTSDKNQFVPEYCGSCWAHASSSALSDRIKIARNAAYPDVEVSRQVLLNCIDDATCDGGDPYLAYSYIAKHGIPDETCAAYVAGDQACTSVHVCKGLDGTAQKDYPSIGVSELGTYQCQGDSGFPLKHCTDPDAIAEMEFKMRSEIATRGPIACCTACGEGYDDYSGGMYEPDDRWVCDHIVSVSGYGTADGTDYWIVRNSFGTYWGDKGWYYLPRGVNAAGIEQYCSWAVPEKVDLDAASGEF